MDVHALRTTFGTHLSKGGVPLRTAQEAMRHSDPKLTANVYTDPKLLDVAGALDALPLLPLDGGDERPRATGTDGASGEFGPGFVPTPDFSGAPATVAGTLGGAEIASYQQSGGGANAAGDRKNDPPASANSECQVMEPDGLEPTTSCMPCKRSPN